MFFADFKNLKIAFSHKSDGSMSIYGQPQERAQKNLESFLKNIGVETNQLANADQVHGINIEVLDNPGFAQNTDGFVTNKKSIFLSVRVADCLPIFFYDPEKEAIGLIHAGWRGLAGGIIAKAIEKMYQEFGSDPKNINAEIGPAICAKHYEVGEDLVMKFNSLPEKAISRQGNKVFLDLKLIAEEQLKNLGIQKIEIDPTCTYESTKYFSFRRDKPKIAETIVALLGMK